MDSARGGMRLVTKNPPETFNANWEFMSQYLEHMMEIIQSDLYPEIMHRHSIIEIAPNDEDMQHNTDLWVTFSGPIRIGCRIRRKHQESLYSSEFTLRYSHSSGAKTEFQKILEGWGDYLLYGFQGEGSGCIGNYVIVDLRMLAALIQSSINNFDAGRINRLPWNILENQKDKQGRR